MCERGAIGSFRQIPLLDSLLESLPERRDSGLSQTGQLGLDGFRIFFTFRCATRYQEDTVHLQWIKAAKADAPAEGLQQLLNNNPGTDPQIPNRQQNGNNEAQQQRQQEE